MGHRRLLTCHVLRSELAMVPLARLKTSMLEQHYAALTAKGLGPKTVRLLHAILASALRKAVLDGLIAKSRRAERCCLD